MSLGSYLLAPGIRFNDCVFSEPVRLDTWTPPPCAGLFGIVVPDLNWAPKPFQALYFGEFGNNASRKTLLADCRNLIDAYRDKTLMVSMLPLPFSTTSQRCALRNELVWAYNPPYQEAANPGHPDLARKVQDLEKAHQEQAAHLMHLLASAHYNFEPPAEPRRRSFGFLPQVEPAG